MTRISRKTPDLDFLLAEGSGYGAVEPMVVDRAYDFEVPPELHPSFFSKAYQEALEITARYALQGRTSPEYALQFPQQEVPDLSEIPHEDEIYHPRRQTRLFGQLPTPIPSVARTDTTHPYIFHDHYVTTHPVIVVRRKEA